MNAKEELTKLLMESYDRGVKDTQQTAVEALRQVYALGAAAEREACAKVCEDMRPSKAEYDQRFYTACTLNANAIKARGNK